MEVEKKNFMDTKKKDIPSEKSCRPLRKILTSGPKFPFLHEGEISVCRLNHQRTLLSKLLGSKLLRRWETHRIVLSDSQIYSTTPTGCMEFGVSYNEIQDVHSLPRWDTGQRFVIQITIPDGLLLLQANNTYLRDQWMHSLVWRVNANRYRNLFAKLRNPEELVKELKELIQLSLVTQLHDDIVFQLPLNTVSNLLLHHGYRMADAVKEALLRATEPLLEIHNPTPAICKCFQKICKNRPHRSDIFNVFVPSVQRILKHNTDFGKMPYLRSLVQDFIYAIYFKDETHEELSNFIASVHTSSASCPHPRVLPNLVAVSLAAFYTIHDEKVEMKVEKKSKLLLCFQKLLIELAKYPDWLPGLSTLLQAVPFPKKVLAEVLKIFARDSRCEVHQNILPIREGKQGWIHHFAPDGICCHDDAAVFADIFAHLMSCCGKRKKFLMGIRQCMRNSFALMAIRGDENCIEALTLLLDFDLVEDEDEKQQIITALQTTECGLRSYEELCSKKTKFREMRKQDGPTHLTLPTKSTDQDLAAVLRSGSFGNLESLNLAFTRVTGACAEYLIQLPALIHLNLWCTQFDDRGLQLLTEHVNTLQSLNLSETPVTDEGLQSLCMLPNLKFLNLNSTKLSALAYEGIKNKLQTLEDVDIRYTEAW
eukprot:gene1280-15665_t